MIIKITALFLILLYLVISQRAIIDLDKSTFSQALIDTKYLLVYYYHQDCRQCVQTTTVYHTFNSVYQNWIHPGKQNIFVFSPELKLGQIDFKTNEQIFSQEQVSAVPEFRLYIKGHKNSYKYSVLDYGYQNLWMMAIWIKRITQNYFPIYQSLQNINTNNLSSKYVIINNEDEDGYRYFINSSGFLDNLDINYIRVRNINLQKRSVLLKSQGFSKKIYNCYYQTDQQTPENKDHQKKCSNMITNFRYRGIQHWSDEIVNNLYNKNFSVLVIVTSNESVSQQYVRQLIYIKNELEELANGDILPIFTVADIYYDLQSSIRVKKFIGGYDLKGQYYPYPLLAYLWMNQQGVLIKYIYQKKFFSSTKTEYTLSQWISKAMKHELQRDFRGADLKPQIQLIEDKNELKSMFRIFYSQLQIILKNHTNSSQPKKNPAIYLYVMWRSSWDCQLMSHKLKKWWENQESQTLFFIYDLYDNELPGNIIVQSFPTFIIYYNNGQFQIKQGVNSQQQIIQIINSMEKKTSQNL